MCLWVIFKVNISNVLGGNALTSSTNVMGVQTVTTMGTMGRMRSDAPLVKMGRRCALLVKGISVTH